MSAQGVARLIFSNKYLYGEFHCEGVCSGILVTFSCLACVECLAVFIKEWQIGELS